MEYIASVIGELDFIRDFMLEVRYWKYLKSDANPYSSTGT
jgi:hypothetical protein